MREETIRLNRVKKLPFYVNMFYSEEKRKMYYDAFEMNVLKWYLLIQARNIHSLIFKTVANTETSIQKSPVDGYTHRVVYSASDGSVIAHDDFNLPAAVDDEKEMQYFLDFLTDLTKHLNRKGLVTLLMQDA